MKNLFFGTIVMLFGLASLALGQSFTFTAPVIELQGTAGDTSIFNAAIHNQENFTVNYLVIMDTTLKPPTWVVSFCDRFGCYPPWVDSAQETVQGDSIMPLTVDFTPAATPNDGSVTMHVQPMNHPELDTAITFHVYLVSGIPGQGSTPERYNLLTAYPNPFNSTLALSFALDHPADADLAIYDLKGARVAQIFQGHAALGEHRFNWNPGNLASGIYLANLNAGSVNKVQKVVYLR